MIREKDDEREVHHDPIALTIGYHDPLALNQSATMTYLL